MHSEPGNIWTGWLFVMHAYSEFHLRSHPPPSPNLALAVFLTCIQGILYEQGTLGISFCCLPLIHVYNEPSTSGIHSGSAFVVCLFKCMYTKKSLQAGYTRDQLLLFAFNICIQRTLYKRGTLGISFCCVPYMYAVNSLQAGLLLDQL